MRAHRSTLPRLYYSTITDTREIFVERRVSASFKDIPGGQILGATSDFTHRLLDDSLKEVADGPRESVDSKEIPFNYDLDKLPKVIDYLEEEGLFVQIGRASCRERVCL